MFKLLFVSMHYTSYGCFGNARAYYNFVLFV